MKWKSILLAIVVTPWLPPRVAEARRAYAPNLKRFTQRDPIPSHPRPKTQHQDGMNPYTYLRAGPLARLDPTGQQCEGFGQSTENPSDYCAWPEECYVSSPGWAQDRPWAGDLLHCRGAGQSTCRCYREITPPGGGPGGHVCFRGPAVSGEGAAQCFDPHIDLWDCCTGVGLDGYCNYDPQCVCRHWAYD